MNKTYVLVKSNQNKDNKLVKNFKNSILGTEVGIKSTNFISKIILSTIISFGTLFVMYYFWRI